MHFKAVSGYRLALRLSMLKVLWSKFCSVRLSSLAIIKDNDLEISRSVSSWSLASPGISMIRNRKRTFFQTPPPESGGNSPSTWESSLYVDTQWRYPGRFKRPSILAGPFCRVSICKRDWYFSIDLCDMDSSKDDTSECPGDSPASFSIHLPGSTSSNQ